MGDVQRVKNLHKALETRELRARRIFAYQALRWLDVRTETRELGVSVCMHVVPEACVTGSQKVVHARAQKTSLDLLQVELSVRGMATLDKHHSSPKVSFSSYYR